MTDKRTRRIQELKKHRERARRLHIAAAVFGVFAFFILCFTVAAILRKTAEVELIATNIEMLKDAADRGSEDYERPGRGA